MKIFTGNASVQLAKKVAKTMSMRLSPVDMHIFPDGERRIQIRENVVDQDAIVIQSAAPPVDTNYMELFFIVDALKRSGARYVTAVVPYFGYQRQDHVFRDGEAVSLEVVIRMMESVGVDKLISFDLHSPKIPSLFHIPVSHMSAIPIFAEKIKNKGWTKEDTVLVSPDMGGIRRIKLLSQLLNDMPYAAIEKTRDLVTGTVSSEGVEQGNVKGKKRAVLVDDMISSGGTIVMAAEVLKTNNIKEVFVFATHPVFSVDAPSRLQHSVVKKIYVTNTLWVQQEKQFPKLKVLSIAEMIARELQQSHK
ncbi:MAG: ribose-phosphate diphosphokinase [Candidatus Levyibacteriota bacterium]